MIIKYASRKLPVVDVAALLTPPDFRFPVEVEVVIEVEEPIISSEVPMASSPNSECREDGGEVEDAGGG